MAAPGPIRWYRKIGTKLTLAVTLAIVLPMLIFYVVSTRTTVAAFLTEARDDLEVAVEHESNELTDFINDLAKHLVPSAFDPELTSLSFEELKLYLSFALRREKAVDSISVVTLDGREKGRVSRSALSLPEQLREVGTQTPRQRSGRTGNR